MIKFFYLGERKRFKENLKILFNKFKIIELKINDRERNVI